jgi:hypothetical protein
MAPGAARKMSLMESDSAAERARQRDLVRRGYDAISLAYRSDDGDAAASCAEDVTRYAKKDTAATPTCSPKHRNAAPTNPNAAEECACRGPCRRRPVFTCRRQAAGKSMRGCIDFINAAIRAGVFRVAWKLSWPITSSLARVTDSAQDGFMVAHFR